VKLPAILSLILSSLILAACSSASYNPTVFDYYLSDEVKAHPIKKVILASVNISGEPTRSSLRDSDDKVDAMVVDYLNANGIELVSQHHFNNAWQQALLAYGNFYDPTTGKVDKMGWQRVMAATMQALKENKEIDAVLFTDLIEHEIQHSASMKHYARWYGVTREPATQGPTSSVPVDFNWTQVIKGASLVVTLYSTEGAPLFTSRGGIDPLYGIDSRKSQKGFVRRSKVLSNSRHIEEGIQLAFHPLIPMDRYPAPPKKAK
jgi:hypothetical protein